MKTPDYFTEKMNSCIQAIREREARFQDFLAAQPKSMPCVLHPTVTLALSEERSRLKSRGVDGHHAEYDPCPTCLAEQAEQLLRTKLHAQGVPAVLLGATLMNWDPTLCTGGCRDALELVTAFATKTRKGFLLLRGGFGVGKSHLAVGAMRHFRSALFVKQSTLLRELRETYRDRQAADPVDKCQSAGLLVLDDFGFSPGGKDELHLLHEILDARYGEQTATIITSNYSLEQIKSTLGPRMADRLAESGFCVCNIAGPSNRGRAKDAYFGN